ncbi:MAG: hypothetical protein KDE14_15425 [Rhodobacteraceae bacterium]|nr:hypothetical protein [Paracoccaceae bacterium]
MKIATSLVPGRDDDIQTAAVKSWHGLGAEILSVNVADEIAALEQRYPAVTFVETKTSAMKIARKPVPFIHDIIRILADRAAEDEVIGLLNSDIILRSGADLESTLAAHMQSGAILLPRVDVPDLAAAQDYHPTGDEAFSVGYDGVFLSRELARNLPDSIFCIGMPFWDYWLPLLTLLQGRSLMSIGSPVALHVTHETRWDDTVYLFFHALITDMIAGCRAAPNTPGNAASEIMIDTFAHVYRDLFAQGTGAGQNEVDPVRAQALADVYDRVQEVVVHHIKARAAPLLIPAA